MLTLYSAQYVRLSGEKEKGIRPDLFIRGF